MKSRGADERQRRLDWQISEEKLREGGWVGTLGTQETLSWAGPEGTRDTKKILFQIIKQNGGQ